MFKVPGASVKKAKDGALLRSSTPKKICRYIENPGEDLNACSDSSFFQSMSKSDRWFEIGIHDLKYRVVHILTIKTTSSGFSTLLPEVEPR